MNNPLKRLRRNASSHQGPAGQAPVVVVGAGVGGVTAALRLAQQGVPVEIFEASEEVGGKAHRVRVGGYDIDAGPTVLTMPWVFTRLFAEAGSDLADWLPLTSLAVQARHVWTDGSCLDLHADAAQNADAIGRLCGIAEARGYRAFVAYAERLFQLAQQTFLDSPRPSLTDVVARCGIAGSIKLARIDPFRSMHRALRDYFTDPRLLQLFGRYATYAGGSPYQTPATLNLIAHVERLGVWRVPGGIGALVDAVARLAQQHGAQLHLGRAVQRLVLHRGRVAGVRLADGSEIAARAVILNNGPEGLPALLGAEARQTAAKTEPALSAMTFAFTARTAGMALAAHNVFFAPDAAEEFTAVFARRTLPTHPTVYVWAPDGSSASAIADVRVLCLINAPATREEVEPCLPTLLTHLHRCGLTVEPSCPARVTTPAMFAQRFAGSGGAIYGAPPHSWRTFFKRPGSRSRLPGLYLCGGSVHPGPGVPMAAQSGMLAAASLSADFALTTRWHPVATPGGISTPKARTATTP